MIVRVYSQHKRSHAAAGGGGGGVGGARKNPINFFSMFLDTAAQLKQENDYIMPIHTYDISLYIIKAYVCACMCVSMCGLTGYNGACAAAWISRDYLGQRSALLLRPARHSAHHQRPHCTFFVPFPHPTHSGCCRSPSGVVWRRRWSQLFSPYCCSHRMERAPPRGGVQQSTVTLRAQVARTRTNARASDKCSGGANDRDLGATPSPTSMTG